MNRGYTGTSYYISIGEGAMKPLQISPETALKLSKSLNLPLEQIMHMPTPVLLRKLAEAEAKEKGNTK